MSKKTSSRERISYQAAQEPEYFQHDELVSAVCNFHCKGLTVSEIRKAVKEKLSVDLRREVPYRLISFAAQRGWLKFEAPLSFEIGERISKQYKQIKNVQVVRTAMSDDTAFHVAKMLMDYVCDLSQKRDKDSEIHIGFAGGKALRRTAYHFSEMLKEPRKNLPKRIVFHAIVAGFSITDPSTDPNGFFAYFAGDSALRVQTGFIGLPAPGVIKSTEMDKLRTNPFMREVFDSANKIDIIVTSAGGHWEQGHSSLYRMLSKASRDTVEQLKREGCIGDLMWRPLGKNGPIDIRTDMRAVTLMEIGDLQKFIRRDKTRAVLLFLGPCGDCSGPKGDVLKAILSQKLITHLVVDSRSARELQAAT